MVWPCVLWRAGGRFLVPLAFRTEGGSVVELVAVEQRAIERGRSRIRLLAPRYELPVLAHDWRLLLPEKNLYRFAAGDLLPAPLPRLPPLPAPRPRPPPPPPPAMPAPPSSPPAAEPGPTGRLTGTVRDEFGSSLPGVTIYLSGATERVGVTDASGRFSLYNLVPGRCDLRAVLDGFTTVELSVRILPNRVEDLNIELPLSEVAEEITVTSEAPLLDERLASARTLGTFQDLVGGVKPLSVDIPESGKLLRLAGVLPPAEVAVELEVKARRP